MIWIPWILLTVVGAALAFMFGGVWWALADDLSAGPDSESEGT